MPLDALRCPSCCYPIICCSTGELRTLRVENGEWRILFNFRIASDEIYKFSATFSGVPSAYVQPQRVKAFPPENTYIIAGFTKFWIALEHLGIPLLTCSALPCSALLCSYSGCRPTLAQLLPLPKVLHELESCCPWGSRTSVPEPVRRASRRLYWGNDSSLGRWRRSIKKRQ